MGLRCFISLLLLEALLWQCEANSIKRERRQTPNSFPGQGQEPKAYQPPLLLGNAPPNPVNPIITSPAAQNSYQPPISLIRSNEYQSPLNHPQNPYPANAPRQYQHQSNSGPQGYILPNQPQHQPHSVQYIPPANLQQSYSVFQQPAPNSAPQPATSYSVHQQPPQISNQNIQGQSSFPILSDNSGLPQSTAERTYSTHSKVVGSSHVPVQAIHKTPASEIQPEKGSAAKEKDNKNDEYVVYYYYYYDNDTTANNNLSLNFDDIPSLEGYDNDKLTKEPEKSASARTLAANVNSLTPVPSKPEKEGANLAETSSSQPRSVGDTYSRPDRPSINPLEDTVVQPLKPVSNVFRYGSNEVPRFPVLPNFIVTEVPTTAKPEISTPDTLTSEPPTTQPAQINAQPELKTDEDADDDDLNNVLDNATDLKPSDEKIFEEEPTTTTTTTTTEPPTTTEEPTTTTEKPRRRPSIGGGRRRFNPSSSSSSSFNSNRNRQASSRSTSSTSSTSTTTTATPTRRSFQGNRIRPRPPIGSNRPRPGSRTTEKAAESEDKENKEESTTVSTTTSRSRFTSASPRRFQSSRSRSQTSSSTTSTTTRAPSVSSRSRPTSRPRPNLITRNRPPRPGFLRPRPGSEPEEPETTTAAPAPTEEETAPETTNDELPSTNDESNETEEEDETSAEETEEPTTTEGSRFSALFRPRNRSPLGNRPRPVIGNRPSRS